MMDHGPDRVGVVIRDADGTLREEIVTALKQRKPLVLKAKGGPKLLVFQDNRGRTVQMADNVTIGDLAKLGIRLELLPEQAPLPDHWYAHPPLNLKPSHG